jgi:hypothetical protein
MDLTALLLFRIQFGSSRSEELALHTTVLDGSQ